MSVPVSKTSRVAFQGERGAFSEEAALKLLGDAIELVPRPTFDALFAAAPEGAADYLLAPIENTLAGSVHQTYDLLISSNLHIIAEVVIPIVHNLIGCPDATMASIRSVESHPVALAQCEKFFARHPELRRIAMDDTAGSVRKVIEQGDKSKAAVASLLAAQRYGGKVLEAHLEDHEQNYTRFVLLSQQDEVYGGADKLSLVVLLDHKPGALNRALGCFAERGVDLLKIESRPLMGQPWHYRFYLDLKGSLADRHVQDALQALGACASDVRLLGCYTRAQV